MKKFFALLFVVIFVLLLAKACIKRDIPINYSSSIYTNQNTNNEFPPDNKNVILNGVDYIQVQSHAGKFGGELILSTIGEGPKTFNPCVSRDATSSAMAGLLYDGLFTTSAKDGRVIPQLAKSYEIKGNDYIITLRHGLKWTDGKDITADDVIYTYKEIVFKGLGNTASRDAMLIDGKLPTIEKIDNYTVKFTTSKPFAPFLRQLTYPIVPKHYFKPYSDKGDSVFSAFLSSNTKPETIVANGAFRLKEYVAAQRVVFVRNKNYYKINTENKKLPYIDTLIYLIVGDSNNEILKFEAKELDVLGLRGSNVARYKSREAKSDYKIYNLGPDTGTLFITINLNNRKNDEGEWNIAPVKQSWFRNSNFRKAIDYAIDRTAIVQNVANGVAQPLFTAESLNSIYLNKNIKGHPSNIEYSKKLLQKEGFVNKNGVLYDKNNNRVEFDLYTNAGSLDREATGVMIKQDLEALGMKVNFKPIEFNSLVNKMSNTCNWDMVIIGLTGSPLEPHDGKNVWMSNGALHLFNQRPSGYKIDDRLPWEKELDTLFEQGALKLNFDERKKLYDRYQEIIYNENPIIYLYSSTRIIAARKKIKNIFPSSLSGLLHNPEEIYIDNGAKE